MPAQKVPQEIDFTQLVDNIQEGKVIPIIGYELLRLDFQEGKLSILEFMAYEYLRRNLPPSELQTLHFDPSDFRDPARCHIQPEEAYTATEQVPVKLIRQLFQDRFHPGITGIEIIHNLYSLLFRFINRRVGNYRARMTTIIEEYRFSGLLPQLHPTLALLAAIDSCPFFVNATIFKSLQLCLRACRDNGDKPLLESGYNMIANSYRKFEVTSKPATLESIRPIVPGVTVFNLFDTLHETFYVLTESEYVQLINDLLVDEKKDYTDLQWLLSKASLLFLGCNFRDWFLRFFLKFCFPGKRDYEEMTKNSYLIDDDAKDNNLIFYMNNSSIQTSQKKIEDFVGDLSKEIRNRTRNKKAAHQDFIFISFCGENRAIAEAIVRQLDQANIDSIPYSQLWEEPRAPIDGKGVWYDKIELPLGADLEKEIGGAISRSSIVVPIVTSQIQAHLTGYFWKEWDFAVKQKKTIIPIKIGKYDPDMILTGCIIEPDDGIRDFILRDNKNLGIKLEPLAKDWNGEDLLSKDQVLQLLRLQFKLRLKEVDNQLSEEALV